MCVCVCVCVCEIKLAVFYFISIYLFIFYFVHPHFKLGTTTSAVPTGGDPERTTQTTPKGRPKQANLPVAAPQSKGN